MATPPTKAVNGHGTLLGQYPHLTSGLIAQNEIAAINAISDDALCQS